MEFINCESASLCGERGVRNVMEGGVMKYIPYQVLHDEIHTSTQQACTRSPDLPAGRGDVHSVQEGFYDEAHGTGHAFLQSTTAPNIQTFKTIRHVGYTSGGDR